MFRQAGSVSVFRPRLALPQSCISDLSGFCFGVRSGLARGYATKKPASKLPPNPNAYIRPKTPPRRGIDLSWLENAKRRFDKLNRDPAFKRKAATVLIIMYLACAGFGIRYLYETKHRATGEPSPYKPISELGDGDEGSGIPAPADTTPVYDELAEDYDSKIRWEEFLASMWLRRRSLMKHVSGNVLEVACGTGRNIPYLKQDNVSSVTFLDPSAPMLSILKKKFEKKFPDYENVQYVQGKAEELDRITQNSGQKFDTIYESFGLCSHEDPHKVLENFKQVLAPNGKILLLEHGRSTYESMNTRMDGKAVERAKKWGCRWNLDIDQMIKDSGLEIVHESRYHFGTTYFYELRMPQANAAASK